MNPGRRRRAARRVSDGRYQPAGREREDQQAGIAEGARYSGSGRDLVWLEPSQDRLRAGRERRTERCSDVIRINFHEFARLFPEVMA